MAVTTGDLGNCEGAFERTDREPRLAAQIRRAHRARLVARAVSFIGAATFVYIAVLIAVFLESRILDF
jgi:hypothetical protein